MTDKEEEAERINNEKIAIWDAVFISAVIAFCAFGSIVVLVVIALVKYVFGGG